MYASQGIAAEYPIKPLNVLKQILTMFVGLDSSNHVVSLPNMKKYLLNSEDKKIPKPIRVFMYFTSSISIRNACTFSVVDGYYRTYGELSYRPFGFHITMDGTPPIDRPYWEITYFNNYDFNQTDNVIIPLHHLMPSSYIPGFYT